MWTLFGSRTLGQAIFDSEAQVIIAFESHHSLFMLLPKQNQETWEGDFQELYGSTDDPVKGQFGYPTAEFQGLLTPGGWSKVDHLASIGLSF